jgi:hypothetical protein
LDWSGIIAGARVAAGLDGLDSQKVDFSGPHFILHSRIFRSIRALSGKTDFVIPLSSLKEPVSPSDCDIKITDCAESRI